MQTIGPVLIAVTLVGAAQWYVLADPPRPPRSKAHPEWTATTALPNASILSGGKRCSAWDGTRFQCGKRPWEWAGAYIGNVQSEGVSDKRVCTWIHPRRGGTNQVTYREVPATSRVSGYIGLLDSARNGAHISATLKINGNRVWNVRMTDEHRGWHTIDAKTPGASLGPMNISIELTTPNPAWRHVCFQLTLDELSASLHGETL